ncbi:ATP-binding protein [Paenibacillus sp. FSL H8-0280]|uniref:AlbA family DNA-binding domain-containing protein n=1 Tax=Paenibacillus sp. FSL H8-0280 TaxID=2921382 RepID=UPI003246F975
MDNAFLLFNELQDNRYNAIKSMIEKGQEEGLFIEFKEKAARNIPGVQKGDKNIYAKAMSGFSNAAGGVLIWGIEAKANGESEPDIAVGEKPIKHLRKFLTDLSSLISDAITPHNTGVQNITIFLNDAPEVDEGFIVTYIPASEKPPHRAMFQDNKYYSRAGDSFIMMEHFMLEDAFGKRQKPKLEIFYDIYIATLTAEQSIFEVHIGIKNTGRYLATYPSLTINLNEGLDIKSAYNLMPLLQINDRRRCTFAGGIDNVVHPEQQIQILSLEPNQTWNSKDFIKTARFLDQSISFSYELRCEGCEMVTGVITITADQLFKRLGLSHLRS